MRPHRKKWKNFDENKMRRTDFSFNNNQRNEWSRQSDEVPLPMISSRNYEESTESSQKSNCNDIHSQGAKTFYALQSISGCESSPQTSYQRKDKADFMKGYDSSPEIILYNKRKASQIMDYVEK